MDALADLLLGVDPLVVYSAILIQSSSIRVLGFHHRLSVCLLAFLPRFNSGGTQISLLSFLTVNFCGGCRGVTQSRITILGSVTADFHVL